MKHFTVAAIALPFALALGSALPAMADSAPNSGIMTYSAGVPESKLPSPVVIRVPTTFTNARVSPWSATTLSPADRYHQEALVRAQRYAEQQAFTKRFGAGKPVKLRAPRY